MTSLVLALLAVGLLALSVLLGRRRRHRAGELRIDPLPAGLRHLASHVDTLSRFGMSLPLPPPGAGRRRATLIGVR
jgi:hypothetical protein